VNIVVVRQRDREAASGGGDTLTDADDAERVWRERRARGVNFCEVAHAHLR
jgi:hypothetical protein